MCDDFVGKESAWPPVLVVQLTVYKEKVPATSFCPVHTFVCKQSLDVFNF